MHIFSCNTARGAGLAVLAVLLSACGMKGPLTLPPPPPDAALAAPPSVTPAAAAPADVAPADGAAIETRPVKP